MVFGKVRERYAELAGQSRGALGSWNGNDREPARDARSQLFDDKGGGRAGAETEDHPALDELDRAGGRGALQVVPVQSHRALSTTLGGTLGAAELRIAAIASW